MAYDRGDAQRYCGDDGDDGAEHGDRLGGVQVDVIDGDQSAPSVTCGVVSPDVFHVSSFVSEVHWLHVYSQRGGMVVDNFHVDGEGNGIHREAAAEVTVENGVCVDACNVCDIHARIISYFPVCRLQKIVKFSPWFTQLTEIGARFRKV